MRSIGDEKRCADWMRGYNDRKDGVAHDGSKGDAYKRGYGTRYEEEQLMDKGVIYV